MSVTLKDFEIRYTNLRKQFPEIENCFVEGCLNPVDVTECSISGTTIRIYVNDPDNSTNFQRIYNWYQGYLFTEVGIREQNGSYVIAQDSTHYTLNDSMKIINQDTANTLNMLGANICLLYTSPSPRDRTRSRMPSSA